MLHAILIDKNFWTKLISAKTKWCNYIKASNNQNHAWQLNALMHTQSTLPGNNKDEVAALAIPVLKIKGIPDLKVKVLHLVTSVSHL